MPTVDPITDPLSYSVLVIAGLPTPGVARLGDVSPSFKWEVSGGPGTDGGSTRYQGIPPRQFSVEIELWVRDHFTQIDELRARIAPMARKGEPEAFDVAHPALFDIGLKAVVVEDFSPVKPKGQGLWAVTIKFLEFRPPKKKNVVKKPAQSKGSDQLSSGTPLDQLKALYSPKPPSQTPPNP